MTNVLRSSYNWVLSWSFSPYGTWALFFISFAESSFFPIPPDVLLIALCVGRPQASFWYAMVCSFSSVLGGILGYAIGALFWTICSGFFFQYVPGFTPEVFQKVVDLYQDNAFWSIFAAGFTPIPYKVFTIAAGIAKIDMITFIVASVLSRSLRFFLVAGLIRQFGPMVKTYIDKYFNLFAVLFTVLLIVGFLVIKQLL